MKVPDKKPELLLPAGNMDVLKAAFRYGADAVYLGGEEFSLRAKAANFSKEEMRCAVSYAHERGKKIYVTANILAHETDLPGVRDYFEELAADIHPDALIISDPGVFSIAKEVCPEIELHISTQANNTNAGTYRFWGELGAKRVVSARELSMEEIASIREAIPEEMEIETFIHGAMCISYSGRCLLSNYLTGRDANQGECTHPCRWKYAVVEETRPGQYLPLEETERGTFLFNSRDLCMIDYIPELVNAGINSFKIEGRMKTALYVATTARAYRNAIDDYFISEDLYRSHLPVYREELLLCTHRPYGTGFFFGKPDADGQIYGESSYDKGAVYLGMIEEVTPEGDFVLIQKNKFSVGEAVEVLKCDGRNERVLVKRIRDEQGTDMQDASHAKQRITVTFEGDASEIGDVLRKRCSE